MTDLVFVAIVPVKSQASLPSGQMQAMAGVLGVRPDLPCSVSPQGVVTLGLPRSRFEDHEAAKASVGMALRMEYGENWSTRFEVVDG